MFDYSKVHHISNVTPEFIKFLKKPLEMFIHVTQNVPVPGVCAVSLSFAIVLYCTVLCCAVVIFLCTVLYCAVLYCIELCCVLFVCMVFCVLFIVLYCVVLSCAVLCNVRISSPSRDSDEFTFCFIIVVLRIKSALRMLS